jgi:hypothetical protein
MLGGILARQDIVVKCADRRLLLTSEINIRRGRARHDEGDREDQRRVPEDASPNDLLLHRPAYRRVIRVLMVKQTMIAPTTSASVAVAALVLGKAVLIADMLPVINRGRSRSSCSC